MSDLRFEWDARKAESYRKKHGVTFEEAEAVFFDEHALFEDDPDDSKNEERCILLGLSARLRLLVVCHCIRAGGDVIRIISARPAVKREQARYWARLKP